MSKKLLSIQFHVSKLLYYFLFKESSKILSDTSYLLLLLLPPIRAPTIQIKSITRRKISAAPRDLSDGEASPRAREITKKAAQSKAPDRAPQGSGAVDFLDAAKPAAKKDTLLKVSARGEISASGFFEFKQAMQKTIKRAIQSTSPTKAPKSDARRIPLFCAALVRLLRAFFDKIPLFIKILP